jgi:hypothetical protein
MLFDSDTLAWSLKLIENEFDVEEVVTKSNEMKGSH